ncbi:polysaccharide pyruvyl transferase family protein [Arthrobacter alpinus]|uniref:polysaccharide pyruvyl transferase family protein n=1 Tax=Arthrobacter alpinus TaxID=656366 RepID=UPI000679A2BB|nr:polysaccharide pyruvyl transferase family protein [Arthrobacter alpinus]
MKVVVLADIGQHVYHVGDEAMGHAAAQELGSRGIDVVMLSRNPAQSRELYGTASAPTITFPWPPLERETYLDEISRVLQGERGALPPEDQVWDLIRLIEGSDAVLICGGGNMNSSYGWLLYERAAVGVVAAHFKKPLVISGQTLGPTLTANDGLVLQSLLESAQLVGVRESASHQLALDGGLPQQQLMAGLDDAAFFANPKADGGRAPYMAVTFSPGTGSLPAEEYFTKIAAVLDDLVEASGLGVVFIPHMADTESRDQDLWAHRMIAAAMNSENVEQLELLDAAEAATITVGASLVVTSRYHPAVFATGAGIPVVSLSPDHYSDVRLSGALRNWGLEQFNLPVTSLLNGEFRTAALAAWEQRSAIAGHLQSLGAQRRAEAQDWWDGVVRALGGERSQAPASIAPAPSYEGATSWSADADAVRRVVNPLGKRAAIAELELQREQDLRRVAGREAEAAREELQRLLGSKAFRVASKAWKITGKLTRREPS